jgi:hypothetical protein
MNETSRPDPVAVIHLSDLYTEMLKQSAQLAVIADRMNQLPDHEQRIRSLEKWRYSLPVAVGSGLCSGVLSVWAIVHH